VEGSTEGAWRRVGGWGRWMRVEEDGGGWRVDEGGRRRVEEGGNG
jgi:hypothetical protein